MLPLIMLIMLAAGGVMAAEPMGVTRQEGTTVARVWAPNAKSVDLIGEFNGWRASANDRLAPDPQATGLWVLDLKRSLPEGGYQFLINGNLPRRDPYARAVAPDGKKSLFYSPAGFDWQGDAAPAIPIQDLVLYELHVGTFNDLKLQDGEPGTFQDVIKRLDQLVWLGVNAIELMPVHEFSGRHSWGYNPSDLFAVEQAYGGPDGLKALVKACHARGLQVHLDLVHNHYGPENLDLLQFDGTGSPTEGGIYFYDTPPLSQTPWGPRVRFDDPQVQRFVRDNAMMWIEEYHVDGFRWDSTVNIRAASDGALPIPAGEQLLEEINTEIHTARPGFFSIAEDSFDIGNFQASWDYDFHHAVVPVLSAPDDARRDMNQIAMALGHHPSTMWRVVYVDNHDEAGQINGQQRIASAVDAGNPDGPRARKICGLGALLTFTAPGIPLLFMGDEMLESGAFHDDAPLDWRKWTRNEGTVNLHRDLIRLRRNLDGDGAALQGLEVFVPVVDDEHKVLVYWRWDAQKPAQRMVVVMNLSGQSADNIVVPFPAAGPWSMRLNTEWTRYGGTTRMDRRDFQLDGQVNKARASIPPYSARIYATTQAVAVAGAETTAAPGQRPLSVYASVNLVGSFNRNHLTSCPLTLTRDYYWEGQVTFTNLSSTDFRVSANDDGEIFWGAMEDPDVTTTHQGELERFGSQMILEGPLNGTYRFTFEEETLAFTIAPVVTGGPAPVANPAAAPAGIRVWTDVRGQKVEARLLRRNGELVDLEARDGRALHVKISSLSAADREYLDATAP